MNEEIKTFYNKLFQHKNNLPHAQQIEHIKKRNILNKQQKYKINKNNIIYENTLPLINLERDTCPECNCSTYAYDSWRGEKVCPQCGLVLEENIPQIIPTRDIYKPPHNDYTWEEKMFLRKHGHHKYTTNTKEWQKNNDNRTLKTLSNQARLNKKQTIETRHIIDCIGYKKLHSRATKPQIISAVIRYVLKQTSTVPSQLRYNQGIFKDLLTQDTYETVEENINKHFQHKKSKGGVNV